MPCLNGKVSGDWGSSTRPLHMNTTTTTTATTLQEANQRSLCNLEIKPWEADQDLLALYAKIKATVAMEGLKWSENCALVDVAFGVKKIVCTAVIPLNLSMDAIIEEMTDEDEGTFRNEIQSMSMTSMSLL